MDSSGSQRKGKLNKTEIPVGLNAKEAGKIFKHGKYMVLFDCTAIR